MSTRQDDMLRGLDQRVTALESGGARRLVREAAQAPGVRGNVIYAQVNGTVGTGDPTGAFTGAVAIVGNAPADGTGTFQNQYGQSFANGDPVILFQNRTNNQWLTERGGSAGSQLIAFRLVEDKSYADAAKLAKPINTDGTLNSGAASFYVVDHANQFYGKAAYTDGNTAATAHPGSLGYAVRYTDDYAGGVPGYRILAMEGPEHLILVELTATVTGSPAAATCVFYEGGDIIAGGPDSARRPRIEDDDWDVTVYDDLAVAVDAAIGDDWIAAWDRDSERYIFLKPLTETPRVLIPGLLIAEIPAATITGSGTNTVACGSQASAIVVLEDDATFGNFTPVLVDGGPTQKIVTGKWRGKTPLRGSSTEPVMVWGYLNTAEDAFVIVSETDLRIIPGLSSTGIQIPYHPASSVVFALDSQACP